MKIVDIESIPVFNGKRNFLFVVVRTDDGLVGVGESGLTGRELAVQGVIEHFKPLLIGQDPMRTEHLWQVMFRGAFFPAQRVQGAAISAIDLALWDIKGKALGLPVYELLGGRTRDKVLCYCHLGDTGDVSRLVEACRRAMAEGWRCLRWGIPIDKLICEPRTSVRRAVQQLQAVREAVGPEIDLVLDAHTRLDLPEAMRLCREAEPFDPLFIEDPLRCENPDSYRTLRPHVHVPIAAGEQYSSKWEFHQLIEEELIDYCRLDVCLAGGLTESKKIAGWCEVHHIKLAVHNPIGPVASAASLHLNLSCPNVLVQEQPSKPGILPEVFPKQIEWEDGYLLPPTAPGLGVEINIEEARKHPYQPWEPPQTRRLDGSVTNW
jgi:L-alanine-DL-glutamate epimerase-like enolase superfamily enzyme